MCGRGACIAGGLCMVGGVHGQGHVWLGGGHAWHFGGR